MAAIVSRHTTVASGLPAGPAGWLVAIGLLLAGCASPAPVPPPPSVAAQPAIDPDPAPAAAGADKAIDDPSRETVRTVQSRLRERGYDPGPLDGRFGPRTRAAIVAFARDAGLPALPDGISARLLAALDIGMPATTGADAVGGGTPAMSGGVGPVYLAGDAYVYADGRVETVEDVDGDMVTWRAADDTWYRASSNFALPPVAWRSGTRIGQRRLSAAADTLWPLTVGGRARFAATAVLMRDNDRQDRTEWREVWECEVAGTEAVTVPAGRFDTFKIVCFRLTDPAGVASRRVWHYAPALRHFVRRVDSYVDGTPERVRDLAAVRLGGAGWPAAARTGLTWALADGLENRMDGERFTWRSSGVDGEVRIEIGSTSRTAAGAVCRTYVQVLTTAAGERRYPARACRDGDAGWQVR